MNFIIFIYISNVFLDCLAVFWYDVRANGISNESKKKKSFIVPVNGTFKKSSLKR